MCIASGVNEQTSGSIASSQGRPHFPTWIAPPQQQALAQAQAPPPPPPSQPNASWGRVMAEFAHHFVMQSQGGTKSVSG